MTLPPIRPLYDKSRNRADINEIIRHLAAGGLEPAAIQATVTQILQQAIANGEITAGTTEAEVNAIVAAALDPVQAMLEDHQHDPADITGLDAYVGQIAAGGSQGAVDALAVLLRDKADKVHDHPDITAEANRQLNVVRQLLEKSVTDLKAESEGNDTILNNKIEGKADKVHGHAMDDVTDLVTWKNLVAAELLKKADKVHTHKIADVEQLETRLADNYALAMAKASINDENQTVNLGTLMFSTNIVVGALDHPDYGYRLFAASADMFDGETSAFAFGQDLDELYTQVQKDIAQAVSGGVDTDAIQALIDDAVAASELVTLSKHDADLALKADKTHTHEITSVSGLAGVLETFAKIDDPSQAVSLGVANFNGNLVVGAYDHPDYGYRLFAQSDLMLDGDEVGFVFAPDLADLYKTLQQDIAEAVAGGVDLAAIQQVIDNAVAGGAANLVTVAKHDADLLLKADKTDLSPLQIGQWRALPLKTEFLFEAGKQPYYRLLPGNNVQVIGEIKRQDGSEFPCDVYTPILSTLGLATDARPKQSCSWTAPTYGGTPSGAHANIVAGTAGGISVNPKISSPLKVELSGVFYAGPWPS